MWDFFAVLFAAHFDRIFFTFVTVTIVSAALWDIRNRNIPPGPMGLPFLGYLPFLNSKISYKHLTTLTHQYGRVFGVQLGSVYAVVVADVKLIRQVLTGQGFQSKTPLNITCRTNQDQGSLERDSVSLILKNVLESPKIPKEFLENQVQESVRDFLQEIQVQLNDEQNIGPALKKAVGRAMTGLVFGQRYETSHPYWSTLQSVFDKTSKEVPAVTDAIHYVPLLRRLPNYANSIKTLISETEKSKVIFNQLLEGRLESMNSRKIPECIVDAYLNQMTTQGHVEVNASKKEAILEELLDLVNAEWTTTLATLKWMYLYMALYPEIQENVATEVSNIVGGRREVGFEDLECLPYTEATILEIWRHQTIVPFGLPRALKQEKKIGDYILPSDTVVFPLMWAVNHDSRLWENPEVFSPERFLFEDGGVFRNENLLPFQTGNGLLVGDSLRRWIVSLFLANTLNKFQIQFPKDYSAPNVTEAHLCGSTLVPNPYHLQLQNRCK